MKIIVLQDFDVIKAAFDHRIGAWFGVFIQQMLFQAASVHANADRTIMITRGFDHLFDTLFIADITGIDAQTGGPCLCRLDPAFVMEMNVGNDWHRYLWHDQFQCFA